MRASARPVRPAVRPMNRYFVTTTDPDGRRDVRQVRARSAAAAVAELEAAGHRDVDLHTDDVAAAFQARMPEVDELSPAEQLELRAVGPPGYAWALTKKLYRATWKSHLLAAALFAGVWVVRGRPGLTGWAAAAWLAFPPPFALACALFGSHRRYEKLLAAAAWGRWRRVLDLAPTVRGKIPDLEVDAREAAAHAALGRLDVAVRLLERHLPGGGAAAGGADDVADLFADEIDGEEMMPEATVRGRLAEVYTVAGRHDEALAEHRQAHAAAPDDPSVGLDLAMELLERGEATAEARRLIDAATDGPVSDQLAALVPHVLGLWELNAGDARAADARFTECLDRIAPFAPGNPMVGLVLDVTRGWRAIARAEAGDAEGARRDARAARPRLVALNSRRMLDRLDAAVPPR